MGTIRPSRGSRAATYVLLAGVIFIIVGFIMMVLPLGGFISIEGFGEFVVPLIGVVMVMIGVQMVLMAGKMQRI
jgi:hypothetical protein